MPDDELTQTLLAEYEATANNLLQGVNVTQETMNRYHGMTGKLLANAVKGMWSKEELAEQIDTQMDERCRNCHRSKVPSTVWGLVCANFKTLAVCVTILVSVGLAFNRLDQLKSFFRTTVIDARELTGDNE